MHTHTHTHIKTNKHTFALVHTRTHNAHWRRRRMSKTTIPETTSAVSQIQNFVSAVETTEMKSACTAHNRSAHKHLEHWNECKQTPTCPILPKTRIPEVSLTRKILKLHDAAWAELARHIERFSCRRHEIELCKCGNINDGTHTQNLKAMSAVFASALCAMSFPANVTRKFWTVRTIARRSSHAACLKREVWRAFKLPNCSNFQTFKCF